MSPVSVQCRPAGNDFGNATSASGANGSKKCHWPKVWGNRIINMLLANISKFRTKLLIFLNACIFFWNDHQHFEAPWHIDASWTEQSLFLIMACRLLCPNPLLEPTQTCLQLDKRQWKITEVQNIFIRMHLWMSYTNCYPLCPILYVSPLENVPHLADGISNAFLKELFVLLQMSLLLHIRFPKHQVTSHYLNQLWPSSMSPCNVTSVNDLSMGL